MVRRRSRVQASVVAPELYKLYNHRPERAFLFLIAKSFFDGSIFLSKATAIPLIFTAPTREKCYNESNEPATYRKNHREGRR